MWICRTCGNNNSDNARYCTNCGQAYFPRQENETDRGVRRSRLKTICVILAVTVAIALLAVICMIIVSKNSLYGYYVSESGVYSVSVNKDGSCNWYQNGIRFDGYYVRENQHLTLNLTEREHYRDTVFSADIENHNLRIRGGTVDNELFVKQKKPDEIKALDRKDYTVSPEDAVSSSIDTVLIESSSGVLLEETVLLDEQNVKVTALRYEESRFTTLNYEDIVFHIENNRSDRVKVSIAYVRTNGVTQRVYPEIDPNFYAEPNTESDGRIGIDPEYIHLSGNDHIYSLEIALVISDDNLNEIVSSDFVEVPVVDNRAHRFSSTPIGITLVDDEHIQASILGYRIDNRYLYLYFNLKTNDVIPGKDRYIEFLGGREVFSSDGIIKINGIDTNFYLWEFFKEQPERAFSESIIFEEPIDAIQTLEFAFVIYGADRSAGQELRLFSSDSIKLLFDSSGAFSSAEGNVNRYQDAIDQYY